MGENISVNEKWCLYMSFISLHKGYCRKENKSKPQTHFSPCHGRFLQELMLRMSFWLNPPCIPARHSTCEMFPSSPALLLLRFLLLQGKPEENITTPACHPFQGPERQWCAATPCLAAPLAPAICLSWCHDTFVAGPSVTTADGVTELSCPGRESICQEIMKMDHPILTHTACFPFHTLGRMMDSRKKTFSGAS